VFQVVLDHGVPIHTRAHSNAIAPLGCAFIIRRIFRWAFSNSAGGIESARAAWEHFRIVEHTEHRSETLFQLLLADLAVAVSELLQDRQKINRGYE
jgi:hypothetical protein